MADYCTITDVNNLVPQSPFTATTTPTQTQVEAFIHDVSVIVDACLRNLGYVVPVTSGTNSLVILRRMASAGALGLGLQVRLTAVAPDQSIQNNVWTMRFEKWLTALKDINDPFELPDAPRTNLAPVKPPGELQRDMISLSVDSGTSADPANYNTNPPFTMDMKF